MGNALVKGRDNLKRDHFSHVGHLSNLGKAFYEQDRKWKQGWRQSESQIVERFAWHFLTSKQLQRTFSPHLPNGDRDEGEDSLYKGVSDFLIHTELGGHFAASNECGCIMDFVDEFSVGEFLDFAALAEGSVDEFMMKYETEQVMRGPAMRYRLTTDHFLQPEDAYFRFFVPAE